MTRADEVIEWLDASKEKIDSYVILDDEVSCYRGTKLEDNVVDCDIRSGTGLDAANACHAVRILKGTIGPKDINEEFVPNISFQSLFDEAYSMACTLKKIDEELSLAAQCEGDYPGGYPPEKLLPQLCKVMYSDPGYWKQDKYDMKKRAAQQAAASK